MLAADASQRSRTTQLVGAALRIGGFAGGLLHTESPRAPRTSGQPVGLSVTMSGMVAATEPDGSQTAT